MCGYEDSSPCRRRSRRPPRSPPAVREEARKPASTGTASRRPRTARRCSTIARCMREHGVDMPDPQFDGGRVHADGGPRKIDPAKMRAAEQGVREVSATRSSRRRCPTTKKEEFKKAALANARCMREHGIDIPRPDVRRERRRADPDRAGAGSNPESAEVQGGAEGVRGHDARGPARRRPRRTRSDERRLALAAPSRPLAAGGVVVAGGDERPSRGRARPARATAAVERTRPRRPRDARRHARLRRCRARSRARRRGHADRAARRRARVITRGHSLYAVDDEPAAFLLYGALPAWRDFAPGMTDGEDVRQLERNLRALGLRPRRRRRRLGLRHDRRRSSASSATATSTTTARCARGEVVFRDGRDADRARRRPRSATRSRPGGRWPRSPRPTRRVTVDARRLAASSSRGSGDKVTVDLPSGRTVDGRISDVGKVATKAQRGRRDDRGDDHAAPARAASLDQAPVDVGFAVERARRRAGGAGQGAAGAPGRRATRSSSSTARHGPRSSPGLYADDMVEVEGDGLREGRQGGDGAMTRGPARCVDCHCKTYPGRRRGAARRLADRAPRARRSRWSGRRARASRRCCT